MEPATSKQHDDWENWTDEDEPVTPKVTEFRASKSKSRQSNPKLQRLKSRKRQKAQNEKAGIKLVTDLTRFRKGPQHVTQLVNQPNALASESAIKFVDAGALRALEGSPNSASVGNWAWLKGRQSKSPQPQPNHFQVSPDGTKIVIGISPQTATNQQKPAVVPQQSSAWSPDTEDGLSPARYLHANLGIYAAPPVPPVHFPFKNPTKDKLSQSEIDDDDDFTPVTLFEEDGKSPASAVSNKLEPTTATTTRSGWWDHVKTPFKERFSPVVATSEKGAAGSPAVAADEWWKSADEKKTMPYYQQQPLQAGSSSSSSLTLHPTVPVVRVPTPTIASSSRSTPPPSRQGEGSSSEKSRVVMQEHADPSDVPPPYEYQQPSSAKNTAAAANAQAARYRAVFPLGHPLATQFPPSPMPASPGLDASMTARGDVKMADVPLTPAAATYPVLPDRVAGTYLTGDQHHDIEGMSSPAAQVEKTRRRHEKEDYLAHKVGGFWKGRGCLPEGGCYGRAGREGRRRRRIWLGVCLAFLLLTILGVVLGVVLSQKLAGHSPASSSSSSSGASGGTTTVGGGDDDPGASSVWLNLTDFPPIPTGLATIVGADNSAEVTGCVSPATLWSCSLPPEQQAANKPQDANQPMFIFQIQYDNTTRQLWDIPNGDTPTPNTASSAKATSTTSTTNAKISSSTNSKSTSTATVASTAATATTTTDASSSSNDDQGSDLTRRDNTLFDTGVAPNPSPPSYEEMWFLGNWTDGIVSDDKAGEPTPFYISFFSSLLDGDDAGPNMLTDDSPSTKNNKRGTIGSGSDNGENVTDLLPPPILNADGTGAAAQLRPFPYQQPLRLFDRGLATEHYGFYSYFNKTIYVDSMDNSSTSGSDGGVRETSAEWYATWTQTRFLVKIWTKKTSSGGGARLIGNAGASNDNTTAPGSFPYPVTIGEDTHGGDLSLKNTFAYGVAADQRVNTSEAVSFANNLAFGGAVANPRLPDGDLSWGGVDGGAGGCRCEWVNWVNGDGTTDGSLVG